MTESRVSPSIPLVRGSLAATGPAMRWFSPRPLGGLAGVAQFAALIVLASIVLVPLIATALGGFKGLGDLRANPFGLPQVWLWRNYWDILSGARYWQVLGNSLFIALLTVFLTLALSSMAAFTFAHLHFFGDRFLLNYHAARPAVSCRRRRSCRCSSRFAISACSIRTGASSCRKWLSRSA